MKTEAQTLEKERTHVSNCSNTRFVWDEYKYYNYMTWNSSTMLYASYTILLSRLQTCRVGSERVTGVSGLGLSSGRVANLGPWQSFSLTVLFLVGVNCQPGIFLKDTNNYCCYWVINAIFESQLCWFCSTTAHVQYTVCVWKDPWQPDCVCYRGKLVIGYNGAMMIAIQWH